MCTTHLQPQIGLTAYAYRCNNLVTLLAENLLAFGASLPLQCIFLVTFFTVTVVSEVSFAEILFVLLQAYVFILRFKFASVDDRDAWFKKFKILAEYVAENEPSTLAYDACVAEDDPLEVIAFER